MLRFNGQSPTSANGAFSAFPGRNYGTVSGVALQTGMIPLWYAGRAQTSAFGEFSGQPDGTSHPVSWLMPLQAGRISGRLIGATFTVNNLSLIAGRNLSGDSTFTFTVGPSQLELVVSAVGSTSFAFTVTGSAAAVLQAVGAISVAFTVGPSTLGAESGIFGSTTATFSGTATPRATGNLEGAVTPFTELSPQSLAAAVWNALATEFNDPDTMGNKLNLASSGGVDYAALAAAVLAAAQAAPIHADTKRMNGAMVNGTGIPSDLWRGGA